MFKKLRKKLNLSPTHQQEFIPDEVVQDQQQELDAAGAELSGGNCRSWSENVYSKLFLDPDNKSATLAVVKTEISYVDLFTDREHVLFRSRCIGGKNDSAAQMFVYDLMKSDWESRVPHVEAIELNVDIIMSSSPLSTTAQSLLNLIRVEKELLKHKQFRGQLNITIRFAHPYGWEAKDELVREQIHQGLRDLYAHGVNLGALDFQGILEEMRLDGLGTVSQLLPEELQDEKMVRKLIGRRQSYQTGDNAQQASIHPLLSSKPSPNLMTSNLPPGVIEERQRAQSRMGQPSMSDEDQYQAYLMNRLDNILEPDFETRGIQRPTSVARHVMSTTPKKCFDQVMSQLKRGSDAAEIESKEASILGNSARSTKPATPIKNLQNNNQLSVTIEGHDEQM